MCPLSLVGVSPAGLFFWRVLTGQRWASHNKEVHMEHTSWLATFAYLMLAVGYILLAVTH
ncbi:hypothetical protein NitYY0814_C0353 [Nitratiruptor sp. YY08-14]|nr:hypothetical protein NitYY0810_C0353 [Nitratiruptor sp. YY08-10]BCD63526.1 hypothetical protein NitYY0814_C0353 [Nitratiruptor sp. YY08-14]BCD83078.1 hypothetical protein NrS2_28 [Nitratiruptor phage NrS-2]BCD83144.1 hypothetical protein NrS3_28 [Nitratiruptor phage NrS-3]